MAAVAGMCAQARTKYTDFVESTVEVIQDEVIAVGEAFRLAAGDGSRKGDISPEQRADLLGLMTELCQMQQEAACRSKALEAVEAVSRQEGQDDLPSLYEQEVATAMEKRKPLAQDKVRTKHCARHSPYCLL